MDLKIEDLKKDLEELDKLNRVAVRQRTKNVLDLEIRKLSSEISKIEHNQIQKSSTQQSNATTTEHRYVVKLTNYAWDQSNTYVKFYITLNNVHSLPQDAVYCNFTDRNLELHVKNLENKDYYFTIKHLLKKINPEQSVWRVRSDMVIISVAKIEQTQWSHVTELEKKASDSQKLAPDEDKIEDDASSGLMSLMKKMYDKGDDEMKRTIAKAWTESQNKVQQIP